MNTTKPKLGRPRMGDKTRVVLSASVHPDTLKKLLAMANKLPPGQRRLGILLDQMSGN
jgi:hypothetical protein